MKPEKKKPLFRKAANYCDTVVILDRLCDITADVKVYEFLGKLFFRFIIRETET